MGGSRLIIRGVIMNKISKWFIYFCGLVGLVISVRFLFRSISNQESILSSLVGIVLWILYILVLHFEIKKKQNK